MANRQNVNSGNNVPSPMGYPMYGQGMGYGAPSTPPPGDKKKNKKKSSKQLAKEKQLRAERKARAAQLSNRQRYAMQNANYRSRIEAIEGRGGVDNSFYRLPEDRKQKRGKDYFFVMRKMVCFLMFLVLLVSVAYFALGFVKIDAIPGEFLALFAETEAKAPEEDGDETEEEENTEGEASSADFIGAKNAEGEEAATEGEDTEVADDTEATTNTFEGTLYGVTDPIFGFLKFVGNKVNIDINLGESPLYDQMIAKVEVGMADSIAPYIIIAFPVALILYLITAFIMMIKAFIGIFGKRIVKNFGLGSIFMIIFAALTAFGGLAFTTELTATMNYGGIVNILMGLITQTGGFTAAYGLLILLALPVIVLILSMFCRKKIPYSIFDTFGE